LQESSLIDINQLLKEEVQAANFFINKSAREVLEPIYLSAAKKLIQSGAVEQESDVSAKLSKIFGPDHERNIRRWLPAQYKHDYVIDETKEHPRNIEEELLKLLGILHGEMTEAINTLFRKVHEEPKDTEKYQGLMQIIHEQFGNSAEIPKYMDKVQNMIVELAYIKELQDERQKIGAFEKMMLKVQLLFFNKDHVAKTIQFSSKWIKNGVEKDEELQKALDTIRKCPQCCFDIADWFNKAKIRHDKGLPIPEPPIIKS